MALNFDLIQKNHTTSAVLSNIEEKSHANSDYSAQVARYIILDIIGLETIFTKYILNFFIKIKHYLVWIMSSEFPKKIDTK